MATKASLCTALVHTKNSAQTLAACLLSLQWVDQILVIDMESQDASREIAQKLHAKVLTHPDVGYVEPARAFALEHVKTPWTLIIDADEEVPPALAKKLQQLMTSDAPSADRAVTAYFLPRQNIIFNRWIEHTGWWPDYQLRLFQTGQVSWPDHIHAQPVVEGTTAQLPAEKSLAIIHHNYQTIEQFIDRLNRYTSIEVHKQKKPANDPTLQGFDLPTTFADEFVRRFFVEHGYQDGEHGLALAYLQAMYQVTTQLKYWQAAGFPNRCDAQQHSALTASVREMTKRLHYWTMDDQIQHSTGWRRMLWQLRRKIGLAVL